MNNSVFGATMEHVQKQTDVKLVTTERRRDYLLSEPNYYTTNFFTENLLTIERRKTHILLCKPVYLILDPSITVMYEFWYDHVKPKYPFIIYVKTGDIYKSITEDVETKFDTSYNELYRPLPKGKNKKVLGITKDEKLKRAQTYSYLID